MCDQLVQVRVPIGGELRLEIFGAYTVTVIGAAEGIIVAIGDISLEDRPTSLLEGTP